MYIALQIIRYYLVLLVNDIQKRSKSTDTLLRDDQNL